jgi:CRISPR-associated protein Csb2
MLALRCQLLGDTFEGGAPDDPGAPEWPPSWMRLYSALVAVADHAVPSEVALLEKLEKLKPPAIVADPPALADAPEMAFERQAWVPTNKVEGKDTATTLPGRKNGARSWARFVPRSRDIVYAWDDDALSESERALLASLCRRVPYLGRSTSPVIVEVVESGLPEEGVLVPSSSQEEATADPGLPTYPVRTPFNGALAALRAAHERKVAGKAGDPWAIGAYVDYRPLVRQSHVPTIRGPYRELVIFALEGPQRDGRHAVEFTDLFRKAVMANLPRQLPAVHGHGPGDAPRCAFLALPFVGHRHADGHIIGLAVAVPELEPADLRDLWWALGATAERGLSSPSLGQFSLRRLTPLEQRRAPLALQAWRWCRPSDTWVTAYPAVLDRFVKDRTEIPELIRQTIRNSGFPEPTEFQSALRPFDGTVPGALDLAPWETTRPGHKEGFRPYRHLYLRFAVPVQGPVVIGSMRHYGLGLCVPVASPAASPAREVEPGDA